MSDRSNPVIAQEQELWANRIALARRLAELRTEHDNVVSVIEEGRGLFKRAFNAGDRASLTLDLSQIPGFVSRAKVTEARRELVAADLSVLILTDGFEELAKRDVALHLEAEIIVAALAMNDAALEKLEAATAQPTASAPEPRVAVAN